MAFGQSGVSMLNDVVLFDLFPACRFAETVVGVIL
jgi:hypothetical protein